MYRFLLNTFSTSSFHKILQPAVAKIALSFAMHLKYFSLNTENPGPPPEPCLLNTCQTLAGFAVPVAHHCPAVWLQKLFFQLLQHLQVIWDYFIRVVEVAGTQLSKKLSWEPSSLGLALVLLWSPLYVIFLLLPSHLSPHLHPLAVSMS